MPATTCPQTKRETLTPAALRRQAAAGLFDQPTSGYCQGHVQANLVVLPDKYASDFETFCRRNPQPCPLLEIVGPGAFHTAKLADHANLLTDLPRYRLFENGVPKQTVTDITPFYRNDLVFFLLGCSFAFEDALIDAGIGLRHVAQGKNVAMYNTCIDLSPAGRFQGQMVVSMRPIDYRQVVQASLITAHYPDLHGAPVHIGYPALIGIDRLDRVDYGDPVDIAPNEIPVFWACGVTPQNVLRQAAPDTAMTHYPGYMFVGDLKNQAFYRSTV